MFLSLVPILTRAFLPAALLVLLQVVLMLVGWYAHFPWFDIPMHLAGGFIIASGISTTLSKLQERGNVQNLDHGVRSVLIFSLVVTAAVFWECLEHFSDYVFDVDTQISLQNTMQDLMLGMFGGAAFLLLTKQRR